MANVGAVNTERTPSNTDSKQDGMVPTGSIGESPGQRAVVSNADASSIFRPTHAATPSTSTSTTSDQLTKN
ncbi:hypothetical protein [Saccharopolyspora hattusasensis]|uniref:hypothetical protein n=1 Tax=Saccharopolyspora hattusasensis TaxID=1128679 RepID=UPI003D971F07